MLTTDAYSRLLDERADTIARRSLGAHAGETIPDLDPPIALTTAYRFESAEHAARTFQDAAQGAGIYARWHNPTVARFEREMAALENADDACATASGMAAVSGVILALLSSGDHIVAPRSVYGETARLLRDRLPSLGIETSFIETTEPGDYAAAARRETKLFWIETPSNPMLRLTPVREIASLASTRGIATVADNTFATPFGANPLDDGVTAVVHSATKAVAGHGDVIAGVVLGSDAVIARVRDTVRRTYGGVLSAFSAYLASRGLRTLALRQRQASLSALTIARHLADRADVATTFFPGLDELGAARSGMHAYGSMLSIVIDANSNEKQRVRAFRFLDALKAIERAVSLGDTRSLATHSATTTHASMPPGDRARAGISEGLVRLSIGIEPTAMLLEDIDRALDEASSA